MRVQNWRVVASRECGRTIIRSLHNWNVCITMWLFFSFECNLSDPSDPCWLAVCVRVRARASFTMITTSPEKSRSSARTGPWQWLGWRWVGGWEVTTRVGGAKRRKYTIVESKNSNENICATHTAPSGPSPSGGRCAASESPAAVPDGVRWAVPPGRRGAAGVLPPAGCSEDNPPLLTAHLCGF